jgi:hypothetical protein
MAQVELYCKHFFFELDIEAASYQYGIEAKVQASNTIY